MNQLKYRLKKRMFRLRARHKRGFGIHSPYVFHLLTNVIEFKATYYAFGPLEQLRKKCLQNLEELFSNTKESLQYGLKRERSLVRKGKKQDQLIFKLANFFSPQNLYNIGGGAGISTAYMAMADTRSKVFFVSDEQWRHQVANPLWDALNLTNIHSLVLKDPSDFSVSESVDFVLFSSVLNSSHIESYWQLFRERIHAQSIVIIRDIHRDSHRKEFWNSVKQESIVRVSIDLFGVGLLLFREGMQKENYVIRY